MSLQGEYYKWNMGQISNSPQRAGVYALLDENKKTIYIGKAENINERFRGYYSSNFRDDPCKKATRYYQREVTNNFNLKEKELLDEYARLNERLPKCNDIKP